MKTIKKTTETLRVELALTSLKKGEFVILTDDEDRENEGDLVLAAEFVSAEKVNFLAKHARGLICLTMEEAMIDRLDLPMMNASRTRHSKRETAFTVSIEAREGVTTGISAKDRATTIAVAIDDKTKPADILVPGHIFPLKARNGGVLERTGHTEGSVDLMKLAGLKPAGVICEIMNDDGTMARGADLKVFAEKHNMIVLSIKDLIEYRLSHDSLVEHIGSQPIQTPFGERVGHTFKSHMDGRTHLAITQNHTSFKDQIVDVRVHAQRTFSDVFRPESLNQGMSVLTQSEHAVFLYLTHDNSDRILSDIQSLATNQAPKKEVSSDSPPTDFRQFGIGAQILKHLGVEKMNIITSKKRAFANLEGFGLEICSQKPLEECHSD